MIVRTHNNTLINIDLNECSSDFEIYKLILYLEHYIKL